MPLSGDPSDIIKHLNHSQEPFLGTQYSITTIGSIASQALSQDQDAVVWGSTSHGIFVHLASGWVVFLSFDHFTGPLTLNLSLSPSFFQAIEPGLAVRIRSTSLHIDTLEIEIATHNTQIWSAPPRNPTSLDSPAARLERIEYIHRNVSKVLAVSPSAGLLPETLPTSLDSASIVGLIERSLGFGEGLTPAGDDLALGFLLALNRWGDLLCPSLDAPEINQKICQAARCKTSTLSANLIECASLGQADERLIVALNGILTGSPDPETCAAHLLSWGHTSGACAFRGMLLANALQISPAPVTIDPIDWNT
jgi:hypothetical protein